MKANTKRNEDLVRKRLADPAEWTFRALGAFFRLDEKTVHEIFTRDLERYATTAEIKEYQKRTSKAI